MRKWLIAAAIIVVVFIVGITIYLQPNSLAGCSKTPSATGNCRPVDAIVAISGGDTTARANWAISLFKNGWANTLIFSGAAQDKTGPSNAAVMRELAIASGVPSGDIYIDENAATTGQNAENAQAIFAQHDMKRVILVTSGYHQRRAYLEFNKHSDGVVILNSPDVNDNDWSIWWWTTLRGWWLVGGESGKIIIFYVTGI
jgi:uncharacterized SAM-binding protein YcdF (DUF218 family)